MGTATVSMTPSEAWNESLGETAGLVSRAQAGDTPAFERLYRSHAGRVYAVCLRITADRPAAEECTQDAFIRAWEALAQFRGASSFGTWLTRIAINVALQRLKLDRRHLRLIQPAGKQLLDNLPAPADMPEADMDMERLIAKIGRASCRERVLSAV